MRIALVINAASGSLGGGLTPADIRVRLAGAGFNIMRLTIRSARPDDEIRIAELWRACGLVTAYNDPGADFRFARAGACSDVLVGEDAEAGIRGSVMVGHDGHRGWLYYVAADPAAQGVGYGRQMVEAGEAWLRARAVVKVQLLVRETNARVVAFYEHLGFAVAPRTVMAKWLVEAPEGPLPSSCIDPDGGFS